MGLTAWLSLLSRGEEGSAAGGKAMGSRPPGLSTCGVAIFFGI